MKTGDHVTAAFDAGPHAPRHAAASGWRRWVRLTLAAGLAVSLVLGAGVAVQAWRVSQALRHVQHFAAGPKAAAGPALNLPAPLQGVVTFLLFTTGSRGMSAADAKRYHIHGLDNRGEDGLTDTIMLVVVDTHAGSIRYLSIPRDTWVPRYGSKINQIYVDHGVAALVDEVQTLTGVPVNHVAALGFTAFGRFTDAAGGVNIDVPVPTRDPKSGLLITSPGCTHMNGWQALAFARSRHTQVMTNGVWRTDPGASDFQRVARQQVIADAFVHKLLTPKLPLMATSLANAVADEVTTDADLSIGEILSTGLALARHGGLSTHHFVLPSQVGTVGTASVTFVEPVAAARVLEDFGNGVPGFELPKDLPRPSAASGSGLPGTASSTGATPSATSETPRPAGTPTASAEVVPEGVTLTTTARYRVC